MKRLEFETMKASTSMHNHNQSIKFGGASNDLENDTGNTRIPSFLLLVPLQLECHL